MEITMVACGDTHTIALSSRGQLYSFGRNQNGQLGLGTSADALSPTLIESLQVSLLLMSMPSVLCATQHCLYGQCLLHHLLLHS